MKKGGKVVHVSDELHESLRQFCQSRDVTMKEWVEKTLTIALESRQPVEKKSITQYDDQAEEELWSRPPFWMQKPRRRDESAA